MVLSPVENRGQIGPIRFLPQIAPARLGPGYDHRIQLAVAEIPGREVSAAEPVLRLIASRNIGQREKMEMHNELAGSGVEKIEKLSLGIFQGRVGHVVYQPDVD